MTNKRLRVSKLAGKSAIVIYALFNICKRSRLKHIQNVSCDTPKITYNKPLLSMLQTSNIFMNPEFSMPQQLFEFPSEQISPWDYPGLNSMPDSMRLQKKKQIYFERIKLKRETGSVLQICQDKKTKQKVRTLEKQEQRKQEHKINKYSISVELILKLSKNKNKSIIFPKVLDQLNVSSHRYSTIEPLNAEKTSNKKMKKLMEIGSLSNRKQKELTSKNNPNNKNIVSFKHVCAYKLPSLSINKGKNSIVLEL